MLVPPLHRESCFATEYRSSVSLLHHLVGVEKSGLYVEASPIGSADKLLNHFSFVDGRAFESTLVVVGKFKAIESE